MGNPLEEEISHAFPRTPPPSHEALAENGAYLADERPTALAGLNWTELTAQAAFEYRGTLFFFSPTAWHHFLPGFLLATLRLDPHEGNQIADILLMDFSQEDHRPERLRLLSSAQLDAILSWLESAPVSVADPASGGAAQFIRRFASSGTPP